MSFDIYGDRAAEAMALIREFARVEYWDYFKGDPERALEAFCVMQDAAEAKSAAKIADLEAQVSALKAAGGVPEGFNYSTEKQAWPDFGDYVLLEQKRFGAPNEMFVHKVVQRLRSNTWIDVPAVTHNGPSWHDHMEDVVHVVCCGVSEDRVLRYRASDCKPHRAAPQVAEQTKQQKGAE